MCSPRQFRRGMDQRHHVLQLVAEAKRAARLIESRTAPDAARQALIQQPAIQQQVHGGIRRADLHRAEQIVPEVIDGQPGTLDLIRVLKRVASATASARSAPWPSRNHTSSLPPGGRSMWSWSTAHGSRPAWTVLLRPMRLNAAGCVRLPRRPRNSLRSAVRPWRRLLAAAKAARGRRTRDATGCAPAAPGWRHRTRG